MKTALYVAAQEESPQSGRLLSLAAASPAGAWFYAEVTDFDVSQCSQDVRECVIPKLRKVTDTAFVKAGRLGPVFANWLARNAPCDAGGIEIRALPTEPVDVASLRVLLQGHEPANRLEAGVIEVNHAAMELGLMRCGGRERAGSSAIIRAVLAAVCDQGRQEPVGALNTRRFELLIGTRNATSLRAWIRRFESARTLPSALDSFSARNRRSLDRCGTEISAAAASAPI